MLLSDFLPFSAVSKAEAIRLIHRSDVIQPAPFDPISPLSLHASILSSDHHTWSADYSASNGYQLFYLHRGTGLLQIDGQTTLLTDNSLFFFPLARPHHLTLKEPVWEVRSLLLSGAMADYYYQLFSNLSNKPVTLSDASPLLLQWKSFHSELPGIQKDPLLLLERLVHLLHTALNSVRASTDTPESVPAYLLAIREEFHMDCSLPYTLDALEATYHISKYRIVKEFHHAFGCSPIAYLNRLRLQTACDLLLTSRLPVHAIAGHVGFETTSHFINLFRDRFHMTPGAYRKLKKPD